MSFFFPLLKLAYSIVGFEPIVPGLRPPPSSYPPPGLGPPGLAPRAWAPPGLRAPSPGWASTKFVKPSKAFLATFEGLSPPSPSPSPSPSPYLTT